MYTFSKNISLFILSVSLVSCGGSGGNDNNGNSNAVGEAFYIDSAVKGVRYICGNQEGVTAANGSFHYETGKPCTFYLDTMQLRTVNANQLESQENFYENDLSIIRALLSLDSDNNPDNGIELSATLITALINGNITSFPITEAQKTAFYGVISSNAGTVVTEAVAATHFSRQKAVRDIIDFWDISESIDGTACGEGHSTASYEVSVNLIDNNQLEVTTPKGTYSAILNNNLLTWTGSHPDDGGDITTNLTLTRAADCNSASGSSSWSWTDGTTSCSGTTTFTAQRREAIGCAQ